MIDTCFVLSESELPVAAEIVYMAARTAHRRSVALRHLSRSGDVRPCKVAIEKDRVLEVLIAVCVTGFYCQHEGELSATDYFHVTNCGLCILAIGVVFVKSVAVDVDRNTHMWQAVCAHGGGGLVVAQKL